MIYNKFSSSSLKILNGLATFLKNQPHQISSLSWDDRPSILRDDVNLFCWDRTLDEQITTYLSQKLKICSGRIIQLVNLQELDEQLEEVKLKWGATNTIGEALFWQDVKQLVADFLQLSGQQTGKLYLNTVNNDACTKFHIDGYRLRLFTTYLGPGTEWLPERAVNRSGLGKTNEEIVKIPDQIQRMNTGVVGILKGELANTVSKTKGIVHRSPSIKNLGLKRITLRIDI